MAGFLIVQYSTVKYSLEYLAVMRGIKKCIAIAQYSTIGRDRTVRTSTGLLIWRSIAYRMILTRSIVFGNLHREFATLVES